MTTRISPKNNKAVISALKGAIKPAQAQRIVKTIGGRNGKVSTRKELSQLKAIRTQFATAFTTEAKKLLDREISTAAKNVASEARAPQRPIYGYGGSGGGGS